MFLKNDSTRWIDYSRGIIAHYNKSPTSGLKGLTPHEAATEAKKPEVLDMNIKKSLQNRMSNDLNPGDKVRMCCLMIRMLRGQTPNGLRNSIQLYLHMDGQ